jgi:hypothetical protein
VGGFSNGSVVALKQGQLVPATSSNILEAEMLLVVSDLNAKWKGEPYPSPEQEEEGHWCAFLGQVPLWVDGPVKAGEYLGPVGDGSGLAKVVEVGGTLVFVCGWGGARARPLGTKPELEMPRLTA